MAIISVGIDEDQSMQLQETSSQQSLRQELREYFESLLPADERREAGSQGAGGPRFREIVRQLGQDGWLGIGWPEEYGGRGMSEAEQFIFYDEVQRAGVPFPLVTVNTVGPTLMKHGTDEQKARFLPGILKGEIVFAIGYTEPSAGTDLASLTTKAVQDGDEYIVNGSKVFTTGGNTSDFVWLACRTSTEERKHQGITILIVPCDDPGYSSSIINTISGITTTSTYYNDIRVPMANVVGEVGQGWRLMTDQLNHERLALAALGGRSIQLYEQAFDWNRDNGGLDDPVRLREFAELYARLEAMRLINWKLVDEVESEALTGATAGAAKVYGTETHVEVQRRLSALLGPEAGIRPGQERSVLDGEIEQLARQGIVNTFGGGVNDVLRDMIATQRLGLPRGRR